mmetsp:Transcript_10575/g.36542  ORF Transcript_10575/g.36542 Transcript_10575/m.36542 type:complete len:263 (+) Transcript_10575:191-979(+)
MQPCGVGRSHRGALHVVRPGDRNSQYVRLELEQEVVRAGAAVHPESPEPLPRVLGHGIQYPPALVRQRLQGRPHQVRPRRVLRQADDQAPGVLPPVRGQQARERGHEVDAASVLDALGLGLGLLWVLDDADAVAEPAHGDPARRHRALQGVLAPLVGAQLEAARGQQPVLGGNYVVSCVHQQEEPRAVGVLGLPRPAPLAEGGGLLVPDAAADGDALERARGHLAVEFRVAHDLGKAAQVDAKLFRDLCVPAQRFQVHQQVA